jgi:hypothetical protein
MNISLPLHTYDTNTHILRKLFALNYLEYKDL